MEDRPEILSRGVGGVVDREFMPSISWSVGVGVDGVRGRSGGVIAAGEGGRLGGVIAAGEGDRLGGVIAAGESVGERSFVFLGIGCV